MSDSPDVFFQNFGARVRPGNAASTGLAPAPPDANPTPYPTTNPASRRQQISLELRWKTSKTYALSYAYFVGVGLDGGTLTIDFTGFQVIIKGKNLLDLKNKVRFQLVEYIQEADELATKASGDPKTPVVYSRRWSLHPLPKRQLRKGTEYTLPHSEIGAGLLGDRRGRVR